MDKIVGSTWVEINLDNLKENLKNIRGLVKKDVKICGVVKADAYGHGAKVVSKYLERENLVDYIAVSRLEEAMELRLDGLKLPILCLGYIPKEDLKYAISNDISITVYSLDVAEEINCICSKSKNKAKVHIKIDTGMSRLGFKPNEEGISDIVKISKLENILVEGIYTHFATADEVDKTNTKMQVLSYRNVIDRLKEECVEIPIKHISNSAAIMDMDELNLDMVRCGVIMYGCYPSNEVNIDKLPLKSVMTFKTRISHVKEVKENTGVSYGYTYKTKSTEKIATIPVGYADGFSRMQKNPKVTIKGEVFDVVGRICMDQCMVRIDKDVEVNVGDEVILFGEGGRTVEDIANDLGTINYEVLCMISRRVSRVYLEGLDVCSARNYLIEG